MRQRTMPFRFLPRIQIAQTNRVARGRTLERLLRGTGRPLGSSQSIGKNRRPACFLRCNVMTILTVSRVFAPVTFLSAEGSPCEEKNERREAPAPMCQTIFLESNGHLPGTWGSREEKPPGLKNKPDHIVPTNLGSGLRELRKVLHGYDSAALQRLGRPCRASKMPVTT